MAKKLTKKKPPVKKKSAKKPKEKELLKLDFGCGPNPRSGFEGVDILDFGQKYKVDLAKGKWPFPDGSVGEAHCSHFLEHLEASERIHFVNELFRVLAPGAKCTVIVPHWASGRAYGDLTHKWPPVSEFWFYYLNPEWRLANAPHDDVSKNPGGYACNFIATWGYTVHPEVQKRNSDYQVMALTYYKEAAQDIVATLVKPSA